ncbi:hypothetical protein FSP39_004673 [Pinctada imbricata]|uniref:Rab-GAP TBC domain-containing protein n=1 Tax=Pinctada imbricata TaxID=66713 RepID=A0AA88XPU7_PINIB|nr:hypothetical protein FSP39_004673 [Pinctada imbricata]
MDSVMAFSSIFKKATHLLGLGTDNLKPPPLDGEIIYCKNNVCVHPPRPLSVMDPEQHHPGYLTLRSQSDEVCTGEWSNSDPHMDSKFNFKKNPRSIESSPNRSHATTPSPRRAPRQEFAKSQVQTPSPASSSPRGSCVSAGSDVGEHYYMDRAVTRKGKKLSIDNSSMNSDDYTDSWSQPEDVNRKLSSSNKSQTDSGIGTEEVQNNEKSVPNKVSHKVGTNVNMLHSNKGNNAEGKVVNKEEEFSSPDTSDGLTPEEQLAAMLNRNKLHSKARERFESNKSVSIEMNGDNLVVVTEELDHNQTAQKDTSIEDRNLNKNESKFDTSSSSQSTDVEGVSLSSDSSHPSPSGAHYNKMLTDLKDKLEYDSSTCDSSDTVTDCPVKNSSRSKVPTDLQLNTNYSNNSVTTPDISVTRCRYSSSSSSLTSGPDSQPPSPDVSPPPSPTFIDNTENLESPSSCDSAQVSHNLTFPYNSVSYSTAKRDKKSAKDQVCGVFSVDLGQMRSIRLFYMDSLCTTGQVVIASRESQYKILHFHHGGLDKLAEIFSDWNLFAKMKDKSKEAEGQYKQFLIVRPQVTDEQCHPEEGIYNMVGEEEWKCHMTSDGRIGEDFQLRKHIFFGGLEPTLRHESWPFLLHYYPYDSSFEEREQIRNDKYIEYQDIRKMRENMGEEEKDQFWRKIQSIVEKDVVRTDRSHPYFKGEDNPNIEVLQSILLNYAVANPKMGYTQGMSDLLAPVLAEIQNEADAYWCFTGLMQGTIFVSSPKDCDMDKQLDYLKELLRLMQPDFYAHLKKLGQDSMELLFCHRWILLCFKREFPETDALKIWEACWSHYQTDYFHLFICIAIVSIYGDDVIDQGLPSDEILLHFSSLAMHMNGELVLRKARGLLYRYRRLPKIPCTLHGLCSLCGPGMWDSGHVPTVECVGNHKDDICPYNSNPNSPIHN